MQHGWSIAAVAAAALATGCVDQAAPVSSARAGNQCFRPDTVRDFDAIDDRTVLVTAGTRDVYALEIVGTCPTIDWSLRLGIRQRGGGSSWVCQGGDAELIVPGPAGADRCPVTNVRKLSEAEVDAYEGRQGR